MILSVSTTVSTIGSTTVGTIVSTKVTTNIQDIFDPGGCSGGRVVGHLERLSGHVFGELHMGCTQKSPSDPGETAIDSYCHCKIASTWLFTCSWWLTPILILIFWNSFRNVHALSRIFLHSTFIELLRTFIEHFAAIRNCKFSLNFIALFQSHHGMLTGVISSMLSENRWLIKWAFDKPRWKINVIMKSTKPKMLPISPTKTVITLFVFKKIV